MLDVIKQGNQQRQQFQASFMSFNRGSSKEKKEVKKKRKSTQRMPEKGKKRGGNPQKGVLSMVSEVYDWFMLPNIIFKIL